MVSSLDKCISTTILSSCAVRGNRTHSVLEYSNFLNSDISQGSVATFVRCGGIFKVVIIVNLPTSLSVKEL